MTMELTYDRVADRAEPRSVAAKLSPGCVRPPADPENVGKRAEIKSISGLNSGTDYEYSYPCR